MNDKGNRYALAALKDKRATLATEIVQLERQLRHRRDMLVHVDATLRLLDPNVAIDAIPNKRPKKRIKLFRQGELGRMIVDAIRRSPTGTASTAEIVTELLAAGGHNEDVRKTISPRVRSNLAYLARHAKVEKTGQAREARWKLPKIDW